MFRVWGSGVGMSLKTSGLAFQYRWSRCLQEVRCTLASVSLVQEAMEHAWARAAQLLFGQCRGCRLLLGA